jgi:benzoate-CoA ligase
VPGFETKICDDAGNEVPAGEVGWLWVRGNSRAIGYWQQMERTMQAFRGEWYASGDMVRQNERGNYVYCGRGDDMLKVSGKWLSPQEVENCLLQHPNVKEVAVVGVVDANGLVKPHAFVIVQDPPADLDAQLKDFACARMEPYKYPRRVHVVEDLPRTHLGKVDRGKLKRMAEEPAAADAS